MLIKFKLCCKIFDTNPHASNPTLAHLCLKDNILNPGRSPNLEKLLAAVSGLIDEDEENWLDFEILPDLIPRRIFALKKGRILIKPENQGQTMAILSSIYSFLLRTSMTGIDPDSLGERFRRISDQILTRTEWKTKKSNSLTPVFLTADDIEGVSRHFPPCFRRIHRRLRIDNRLNHHARIGYTLFLKEIGLNSWEDSVRFWSEFYSKPGGSTTCEHDWGQNGKRFTYNIRHLYGLEGNKVDYSAHSCDSLINRSDSLNCPVKLFPEDILDSIKDEDAKKIVGDLIEKDAITEACSVYATIINNRTCDKKSVLTLRKPSDFFRLQNQC